MPHPVLRLGCIQLALVDRLFGSVEEELLGHEIDTAIEHSATALVRLLGAGRYDAILFGELAEHEVPLPDGVAARTLIQREPPYVRLSTSHPLAVQAEIELADLAGETWTTLTDEGDGGPEAMADACRRAGFTPELRYRIADRRMRWELIAAGRAVCLCQEGTAATDGRRPSHRPHPARPEPVRGLRRARRPGIPGFGSFTPVDVARRGVEIADAHGLGALSMLRADGGATACLSGAGQSV